jgi:hypothetical protein
VGERGNPAAGNFPRWSTCPTLLAAAGMVLAAHRKGEARDGQDRHGPHWVQLRLATGLTCEEYVKQKAWLSASLERCPNHPHGGCSFARHTSYERVEPPGAIIARWYCPESHTTFSLLPDCLASQLSSSLAEVEQVAARVESATEALETVAAKVRPDIGRQGAVRWVRRRVVAAAVALLAVKGLRPDVLAGAQPTLEGFRAALGVGHVLPALRELAGAQVTSIPPCVGLGHRQERDESGRRLRQQGTGADPP